MYVPCSGMHVKVWKGMCHGNSSHSHSGNSADFRVVIHMSSFLLHTSDFYDGCNYSFHYGNRKNVKWLYSSLLVFVIEGEKKKPPLLQWREPAQESGAGESRLGEWEVIR